MVSAVLGTELLTSDIADEHLNHCTTDVLSSRKYPVYPIVSISPMGRIAPDSPSLPPHFINEKFGDNHQIYILSQKMSCDI